MACRASSRAWSSRSRARSACLGQTFCYLSSCRCSACPKPQVTPPTFCTTCWAGLGSLFGCPTVARVPRPQPGAGLCPWGHHRRAAAGLRGQRPGCVHTRGRSGAPAQWLFILRSTRRTGARLVRRRLSQTTTRSAASWSATSAASAESGGRSSDRSSWVRAWPSAWCPRPPSPARSSPPWSASSRSVSPDWSLGITCGLGGLGGGFLGASLQPRPPEHVLLRTLLGLLAVGLAVVNLAQVAT